MKFIISEQANCTGYGEGTTIEAKTLTAAKVKASKAQVFQGTHLKIENEDGDVLAIKYNQDAGGKWHNQVEGG